MVVRSYTIDQLKALHHSPLVAKPENLPAIEQWIEYVYMDQDGVREKLRIPHSETPQSGQPSRQHPSDGSTRNPARVPRVVGTGSGPESTPMGAFSTGRPTMGGKRDIQRGQSGDDIALGPPRTMFPSSRNVPKLSGGHEKNGDAANGDEPESARSRFFSDRQLNRRSVNEKEAHENRGSWSFRKDRGEEGEERGFGRHNKDHDGERRSGYGERHDPRWNREDRRQNGDRERPAGGWREREAARRQREDHTEKAPEWMDIDDPLVKQEQEMGFGVARNADDFQKWKQSMKKGKTDEEPPPAVAVTPPPPVPVLKPQVAPLKLEIDNSIFAGWGGGTSMTTPGASAPSTTAAGAKPVPAKSGKTSRFASMFKPAEPEPATAPAEAPSPLHTNGIKTTAEDHEGFNKMLAMLNQSKLTQVPPPQAPAPAADPEPSSPPSSLNSIKSNGVIGKSKSRFANMWGQKSPERLQSPQQSGLIASDSIFDGPSRGPGEDPYQQQLFGSRLPERQLSEHLISRTQAPESTMSPDHGGIPFNALREQQPRPGSVRVDAAHIVDPPSRGAPSPDVNVQKFLAQQHRRQHGTSMESQQLLNLLRNKGGSNSRPHSGQAQPNASSEALQLQRLLEHQHQNLPSEPHQPKPRVPQQTPGVFEEQLMRNYPQELHDRPIQDNRRPAQQRVPPGFFNEDVFIQHQRQQQQQQHQHQHQRQAQHQQAQLQRMHSESILQQAHQQQQQQHNPQPTCHASNHPNHPQMQIPGSQSHQAQFQQSAGSEYPHHLTSPLGGGPPPGFQQVPRHPPGFQTMNAFNGQREPPGFSGLTCPNGPPGFFQQPPPGFAPQQLRGPEQRIYEAFPPGMNPRR